MKKEFDEIYRLYADDIYRFLLKLTQNEAISQDILQETMLKAIISADKFKENCSIKTWLCTIAKNEYYNYLKRSDNKNLALDEDLQSHENTLDNYFSDRMQALELHSVLHNLEEPYKEIFTLRVFAELKFNEIGKIFGKSENWARVTFFRAKEKIIGILEKEDLL
ncbi:MAG: sigma-70 family RNA polymerase sigma factor [Ruminococcus sp.]|nr:sigma-70 family RNA polymerase sigma factor [Ruminococcus sp.]